MKSSLSKTELASEFGIHRDTLMRWIKNNKELSARLKEAGYKPTQKVFTPQQVNLVYSYFS